MNDTIKQLLNRKSVRVFTDKNISAEDKDMILQCAIEAPTAGNQTMYTILDITDQALLDKLAISCDNQPFIAKSKMCLIYCVDFQKWYDTFKLGTKNTRKPAPGDLFLGMEDALIAAQSSVVAADSLGIGSCYIGDIMENYEDVKEMLNLPEYVYPACMIVFGYPTKQQEERKKPARFARKHVVHENTYRKMDDAELREMFEERAVRQGDYFDFEKWIVAFYNRKYDSDFMDEMNRSAMKYYQNFAKNYEK